MKVPYISDTQDLTTPTTSYSDEPEPALVNTSYTEDLATPTTSYPDEPEPALVNTNESSIHLIYRSPGHTNYKFIKKLANYSIGCKTGPKATPASRQACVGCLAGKLKKSFNKHTDTRRPRSEARIYSDTSGILPQLVQGFKNESGSLPTAITPWEAYKNSLSDFTKLRVFGCTA